MRPIQPGEQLSWVARQVEMCTRVHIVSTLPFYEEKRAAQSPFKVPATSYEGKDTRYSLKGRHDLTVWEQSKHITRREELLGARGMRARVGWNGNRFVGRSTVDLPNTNTSLAAESGLGKRSYQRRRQACLDEMGDGEEGKRCLLTVIFYEFKR